MAYFTHNFQATVALHPLGSYHCTGIDLDGELHASLPLEQAGRLRIAADDVGRHREGRVAIRR